MSLIVIPDSGAFVGAPSTRVQLLGLLLRTAWASNSCDKYDSHGDRGHFSQTNNSRMFICGNLHLVHSACLPLLRTGGSACLSFPPAFALFSSFPDYCVLRKVSSASYRLRFRSSSQDHLLLNVTGGRGWGGGLEGLSRSSLDLCRGSLVYSPVTPIVAPDGEKHLHGGSRSMARCRLGLALL